MTTAKEATELQAQISHYLTETKRLNEQMARDQERIATLKAESQVIVVETRVLMEGLRGTLSKMGTARSMWNRIGDYVKQVFLFQQETQKNKADIVELRQELKEVRQELRNLTIAM